MAPCHIGDDSLFLFLWGRAFSSSVDPSNPDIQKLKEFVQNNEVTTGKFTIADEKKHNVRRLRTFFFFLTRHTTCP